MVGGGVGAKIAGRDAELLYKGFVEIAVIGIATGAGDLLECDPLLNHGLRGDDSAFDDISVKGFSEFLGKQMFHRRGTDKEMIGDTAEGQGGGVVLLHKGENLVEQRAFVVVDARDDIPVRDGPVELDQKAQAAV